MTPGTILPEATSPTGIPMAVPFSVQQNDSLKSPVIYPERDGKPMSDNTRQARWIFILYGNLSALFWERTDVFVAADLLWYPEEDNIKERTAPDVMVIFGVPKKDRGAYVQALEGPPPAVVFEILSPGNTGEEMIDKQIFYDEHGVQEYYIYNPETNRLIIFTRGKELLRRERDVSTFVSPLLGIRFEMTQPEMTVYGPDGQPFLTFEQLRLHFQNATQRADEEKRRADEEKSRADEEKSRADEEKRRAEDALRLVDEERRRAEAAERQRKRQTELGRKVRRGEASADEIAELDRLENEAG